MLLVEHIIHLLTHPLWTCKMERREKAGVRGGYDGAIKLAEELWVIV